MSEKGFLNVILCICLCIKFELCCIAGPIQLKCRISVMLRKYIPLIVQDQEIPF